MIQWQRSSTRILWVGAGALVIAVFAFAQSSQVATFLASISNRIESLGPWGVAAFIGIYVVAALLLVPGSVLTITAGALFGVIGGTIVASLAATTVAAIAFTLARYVARDRVERLAGNYPRFEAIDDAVGDGGWKVVGLLRLSPLVPFNIANYLFGVTAIPFLPYLLASWGAMLPGTILYVYIGYVAEQGLSATVTGDRELTTPEWVMLGIGLVATIAVTILITRNARAALEKRNLDGADDRDRPDSNRLEAEPAEHEVPRENATGAPLRGEGSSVPINREVRLDRLEHEPPKAEKKG